MRTLAAILVVLCAASSAFAFNIAHPSSIPTNGAIFFVAVDSEQVLDGEEWYSICAIEAAGRIQGTPVYILTDNMFNDQVLDHLNSDRIFIVLWDEYVDYWRERKTLPSLLEWYDRQRWEDGYVLNNLSNAFRLVLLFNHGGAYFDLDEILLRPLNMTRNVVGFQTREQFSPDSQLNNAALIFQAGHPFLERVADIFVRDFVGTVWGNNGPICFTKALAELQCDRASLHYNQTCGGVSFVSYLEFYAVHVTYANLFFEREDATSHTPILKNPGVSALHLWAAKLSQDNDVPFYGTPSGSLLHDVAKHSCPATLNRFGIESFIIDGAPHSVWYRKLAPYRVLILLFLGYVAFRFGRRNIVLQRIAQLFVR